MHNTQVQKSCNPSTRRARPQQPLSRVPESKYPRPKSLVMIFGLGNCREMSLMLPWPHRRVIWFCTRVCKSIGLGYADPRTPEKVTWLFWNSWLWTYGMADWTGYSRLQDCARNQGLYQFWTLPFSPESWHPKQLSPKFVFFRPFLCLWVHLSPVQSSPKTQVQVRGFENAKLKAWLTANVRYTCHATDYRQTHGLVMLPFRSTYTLPQKKCNFS